MEQAVVEGPPRVVVGVDAIWMYLRDELGVVAGRTWVAEALAGGQLPARLIAGKYHSGAERLREWAGLS